MKFLKVFLLITSISFFLVACGSSSNSSNNGVSAQGEVIAPGDDDDNDGVPNDNDKCEDTSSGLAVTDIGCTAQQTKERTIELLTDGGVEIAIDYIRESLLYFATDNELACDGIKTFKAEIKAIKELLEIEGSIVDEVIASLVDADRILAEFAIDNSICSLPCIERAEEMLIEAGDATQADEAVALFGKAWKKVINCSCDDSDSDSDDECDDDSDSDSDSD
jgi:hypothetical protein